MSSAFARLTPRQQAHRLRRAAHEVLGRYGLADRRFELVNHDFNATFRVHGGPGEQFALRINSSSPHGLDAVRAEAAWVDSLVGHPGFTVPAPVRTDDGDLATVADVDGLDRPVAAVVYRWLPDPVLGERCSPAAAHAIGRVAAQLHVATPPAAVRRARPVFDDVLLGSPDQLTPLLAAAEADDAETWSTPALRDLVGEARRRIDELTAPLLASPDVMIHGDLHPWNVMWRGGHLSVFDFDDCGVGPATFELAISSYYLRGRIGDDTPLLDGYTSVRPLPHFDPPGFEALVASRSVLLLNDLVASETASLRAMVPDYADLTGRRLQQWLDTGVFRLDV